MGSTVFGFNRTLTLADGRGRRGAGRRARADRGDGREPAACPGRYFVQCYRRPQPRAGRHRAAPAAAARLRRLRHAAGQGQRDGRRRRGGRRSSHEPTPARAARDPRPVGARRRVAARARPAVPDRGHGVPAQLPRHRARLPVVARAAADAVRRAAASCSRRRSTSASACTQYPVLLLFNIVLFGFFQEATVAGGRLDRGPGVGRAQDAVPAARDPARGRADGPVQPRRQPRRRARVHPRRRRRPDVDVAAAAGRDRAARRCSRPRCR